MQKPILAALGAFAVFPLAAQNPPTPLTTVRVATGLQNPLDLKAPPGDRERVFIVEQYTGRIRILKNGSLLPTPFIDVSAQSIPSGNERGLLGLAFHPDYAQNGYFYVNYNRRSDAATVVERYQVSQNDPDVADPASGTVMLGPITQPFSNHNGGCLQFGPDGYLYIGMGDGGSGGDPGCRAQNGNELLGKMLRIDVDGASRIPPTNPFVGNPSYRGEIWAVGLRNPWRFSFDRDNGDLYIGDVGQDRREEVSFQPGTSKGGENYGWKIMEGDLCFSTSACATGVPPCNDARLTLPIHAYANAGSDCSVTGGYVYRGCAIPDLGGTYFFADYCSARIWSLRYDGRQVQNFLDRTNELRPTGSSITSITSFGEDGCGEIYIVSRPGNVFKIVPNAAAPARDLGFGKIGGNGKQPRFEVCGLLTAGNRAELTLRDAPPTALCAIVVGAVNNPFTFPGLGTIVPNPILEAANFMTDANGETGFAVLGGRFQAVLYAQWLVLDPGASGGVGVSNALEITFP